MNQSRADIYPYPTAEQFATAKANGLSRENVLARLSRKKRKPWTIEDAITKPLIKPKPFFSDDELRIMRKHGVPPEVARNRINTLEWDRHKALTDKVKNAWKHRSIK